MFEIQFIGSVQSKIAFHVPVIRRWRLVWERREFGTRTDYINETYPLDISDVTGIPDSGLNIRLWKEVVLVISRMRNQAQGDPIRVGVSLTYAGFPIPGTMQIITLPAPGELKFFALKEAYKGVEVDVTATLYTAKG
jgi:hypothetical protein